MLIDPYAIVAQPQQIVALPMRGQSEAAGFARDVDPFDAVAVFDS